MTDLFQFDESPSQAIFQEGLSSALRGIRTTPGAQIDDNGVMRIMTFREFVDHVNPRFVWHRHNIEVGEVLQDIADGKYGLHARVIIEEPPRHGKTEQVSRLFPAYWLYRFPDNEIGLTTYGSDLAYSISNAAKGYYVAATSDRAEEREVLDVTAARQWVNTRGGSMWATGIGGPATGKGWHLGIIDDPVKNAEESQSEAIGTRNWEWFQSVFYTREAAGDVQTALIVMHTRWPGPGDLIGRILEAEREDDEEQEHWHIVHLSAIKEATQPEFPPSCTVHPDWRAPGEALCPARFDEKRLAKIKRRVGSYFWSSIYQQEPRPREGGAFKEAWFRFIELDELRPGLDIRYWDLGASEKGAGGDPTVGVRIRYHGPRDLTIIHVLRIFKTPKKRDNDIRTTAESDGLACIQFGPQDPAAAGKAEADHFRELLEGFRRYTEPVGGNIEILSGPYQSALEGGDIKLVRGNWNKTFINEHLEAWTGSHDDQIWAAANAYLKAVNMNRRVKRERRHGSVIFKTRG
jgi:hypothetical protein